MRLRANDLTWQRIDDEIIVLDLRGSSYLKLNGSGALLWEALAEGTGPPELVGVLVERYDLEERDAARDVEAFLADLQAEGLLEPP